MSLIFQWEQKRSIGISVNLNEELKQALMTKASEHREREAKALGIPVENVPAQLLDFQVQKEIDDDVPNIIDNQYANKSNAIGGDYLNNERQIMRESYGRTSNFGSVLAQIAAEKSKAYNVCLESECFGDSSEEEDADETNVLKEMP